MHLKSSWNNIENEKNSILIKLITVSKIHYNFQSCTKSVPFRLFLYKIWHKFRERKEESNIENPIALSWKKKKILMKN